jgi:hypothetical protein
LWLLKHSITKYNKQVVSHHKNCRKPRRNILYVHYHLWLLKPIFYSVVLSSQHQKELQKTHFSSQKLARTCYMHIITCVHKNIHKITKNILNNIEMSVVPLIGFWFGSFSTVFFAVSVSSDFEASIFMISSWFWWLNHYWFLIFKFFGFDFDSRERERKTVFGGFEKDVWIMTFDLVG